VGVAVVGVLGLDARVAGGGALAIAGRGVAAASLIEGLGVQVAVAGARAGRLRLVEQRRGARALPLLPDRLRAVEAGAAFEVGVEAGGGQGGRERGLGVGVAGA